MTSHQTTPIQSIRFAKRNWNQFHYKSETKCQQIEYGLSKKKN